MSKNVHDIFQEKSQTKEKFLISVELKYAPSPIGDIRKNWASAEKKVFISIGGGRKDPVAIPPENVHNKLVEDEENAPRRDTTR